MHIVLQCRVFRQSCNAKAARFCAHAETNSSVGVFSKKDRTAVMASSGLFFMKRSPEGLRVPLPLP